MDLRAFIPLLALVAAPAAAQSPAAVQKVSDRYTPAQVAEMQERANYRYEGLVLFYSSSFLVMDDGLLRAANEEEITSIDLHQYDAMRTVDDRITVEDATLGKSIVLLGRDEFEQMMLAALEEVDRAAYLAYKAAALRDPNVKQP